MPVPEIAIRVLMAEEACHLSKVAAAMSIPPRTLQHYLKMEGLKFQDLSDKVRLDMAKKYLSHSKLSIAAVAERLHFSETATFTRFFKRMTGGTPRQFLKPKP